MSNPGLLKTIRHVRARWKLALVLRGAAVCVAAGVLLIALSALGFAHWGVAPTVVLTLRGVVALAAVAVFAAFVMWPAMRRVSDERVALYIEEREPALQSLLISAIEAPAADSGLARALVLRAAAQCQAIGYGAHIEPRRVRRNAAILSIAALAALAIIGAGPSAVRHAARVLLLPADSAEAAAVMSISAEPGNATIARGSDFAVRAALHAFKAQDAQLVVRSGDGEWQRFSMSPGEQPGGFEAVLFDVAANTDYYIESATVRSPTYHITVVDAAYVTGLALEYQYPAYTGMAPKRVENGGDIVAPKGTLVRVVAATSRAVNEGRLRLDGAPTLRMAPADSASVHTTLRVLRDGLYHIELPGLSGAFASASAQYAITAIADQPPIVSVEKPGRDIKVTNVDEVFVSAHAEDDYGIAKLDLVYSVNGGAPQTVALASPRTRSTEAAGAHTFFLEELSLEPGDFVSYFVRATDNNAVDGARAATTDIYFIQIKPFSREYRAAEQAGAPGAGQGDEDAGALSERQRQIIAATFNVARDRQTYTPQGFAEALTTIELSQSRLREQVARLLQRMQQRGVVGMDTIFAQIAELLPQATREMSSAEDELRQRRPNDALSPEQRALQQLLRAEALYREVQVQMQQQSGGGSSTGAPPDDLADLFELERDQLRNQYETVQRSQEQQAQQQVDDALERLRELARRQQQEAERQRQAAAQSQQQGSAGGTGGGQRRLADETEQAARQLERLARENNDAQMADAARRLQDAANAMRRASSQRGGRGLADANAARQQLEEARRRLQQNQRESLQQRVDAARERAEQLRAQQRQIARAATAPNAADPEQQRRLSDQKGQLDSAVGELENRLDRMGADARNTNPEAARQLQGAADAIRDSRVRERIRATQGNAQLRSQEFNRAQEEQISRDLDRVAQQLASASAAARAQSADAQTRSAGERARALAQGVEGMRDRARDAQQSPGGAAAASGGQARNGGQAGAAARRQLRAEAGARAQELQTLRRQLQQQGISADELEGALDALRSLQSDATYDDPQEVERLLTQVARGVENFEFDLRQRLDGAEVQKLYLESQGRVPAQFRKAVEEYYRALARRAR